MKNSWIIPCNLKLFDVFEHMKSHDTMIWKKSRGIKNGDIVYIYVGLPVMAVKYRCVVIDDAVNDEILSANSYARINDIEKNNMYMQLKVLNTYEDELPLRVLNDFGIYRVRRQSRLDRRFENFLESINKNIKQNEEENLCRK